MVTSKYGFIPRIFGANRAKSVVYHWVQEAQLEPLARRELDLIALDETVVNIKGERYWLCMADDPEASSVLHLKHFRSRTLVLTKLFLGELAEKYDIGDAEILVNGAPWLQAGLFELGMYFGTKPSANEIPSN